MHRAAQPPSPRWHLARIPVRPVPGIDLVQTDPFTRTIQHLALRVTSCASADKREATGFLYQRLDNAGVYHALPVLVQVERTKARGVRDVAVHARRRGRHLVSD